MCLIHVHGCHWGFTGIHRDGLTPRKLCDGHAEQVCFMNGNMRELCKQRMHLFICSADLHIIFPTGGTNIRILVMLLTEKILQSTFV